MNIAISTWSVSYCAEDRQNPKNKKKILDEIKAAGYDSADIDFFDFEKEGFILSGGNWRDKVKELAEHSQKLGLPLYQGHAPFVGSRRMNMLDEDSLFTGNYFTMLERSVEAAGMLGVKWLTVHPYHDFESNMERSAGMKKNHGIYDRLVYRAGELGFGLSFENMLHNDNPRYMCRFGENYDDLIEFVDSYDCGNVGITWDFGHANSVRTDQAKALRSIGGRLKALHINDNGGIYDDHLYPYLGTVKWDKAMIALGEVGYSGEFALEVPHMLNTLPECVQSEALAMGVPICRKLIGIAGLK